MFFLVAYDIADPARLRRVARQMERFAKRVQKSVFLFHGDRAAAEKLLDHVAKLLDLKADIVQAWKLSATASPDGLSRGQGAIHSTAVAICQKGGNRFVAEHRLPENESL